MLKKKINNFGQLKRLVIATKALLNSRNPFLPYKIINHVQNEFLLSLPKSTSLFITKDLLPAAAIRVRSKYLWEASSKNIQEAILCCHDNAYNPCVLLPPGSWKAWAKEAGKIDEKRSLIIFLYNLIQRYFIGLEKFRSLVKLFGKDNHHLHEKCVVLNVDENVVLSAKYGGFLKWLKESNVLNEPVDKITIFNENLVVKNEEVVNWINITDVLFPGIRTIRSKLDFILYSFSLLLLSPISALFGRWQLIVLLDDLIEYKYFTLIPDEQLPNSYVFLLSDLAKRPLWTWHAKKKGCQTPIFFYASSYSLFSYNSEFIGNDICTPSLSENHWDECFFQTKEAAEFITSLSPRNFNYRVVGAFDMVDYGIDISSLPSNSIAVFDVEPTAQSSRHSMHGYICPQLHEKYVCAFWEKISILAKELNMKLVHKPKRFAKHSKEKRYRELLLGLENDGCYISLPVNTSVSKLMSKVTASIMLPFTSVGDVASALKLPAIYFDPVGGIVNMRYHSVGCEVAQDLNELFVWLKKYQTIS